MEILSLEFRSEAGYDFGLEEPFSTTVMKTDAFDATAADPQAHEDKFTDKVCKYLAATESYPNPLELKSFLCSTWVASIYPQIIRDSIYPSYVFHDLQTS